MKKIVFFIAFACTQLALSQSDALAKKYYEDGAFEKAKVFYEKLVRENPYRTDYTESLVDCYHQLKAYEQAEELLQKQLRKKNASPSFYVILGYTYTLQGKENEAESAYASAISSLAKNTNYAYGVGLRFEGYALLSKAIEAYNKAMELNPEIDFNYQLAKLYGEQGEFKAMINSYLNLVAKNPGIASTVMRNINIYTTADSSQTTSTLFKNELLSRAQKTPNLVWNKLLSWHFADQGKLTLAFMQEKAMYKREDEPSLYRIEALGNLAFEQGDYDLANTIFEFIVAENTSAETTLKAKIKRADLLVLTNKKNGISLANTAYKSLLSTYGNSTRTLPLQLAYAQFLTQHKKNQKEAILLLEKCIKLPYTPTEVAALKMALADNLVYQQRFDDALIYFTQIQLSLKNDVRSQLARFKVAQTSFYKGDFDWAYDQLKVLRSSTSQRIANDAMQLSLLISDHKYEDSLQVALKQYATADLLSYQNKTEEAIATLKNLVTQHKGEGIEDDALLKLAQLQEKKGDFESAAFNYKKIITFFGTGILADDALFYLANLYTNELHNPEAAKKHFETLIFTHQDSYFFPEARKKYRQLRGDIIE